MDRAEKQEPQFEADREIETLGCPPGPRVRRDDHFHRYFRNSTGLLGNTTRQGRSGKIDILTLGYVVGPHSLYRSGERYVWEVVLEECPLDDPPTWATATAKTACDRATKKRKESATTN